MSIKGMFRLLAVSVGVVVLAGLVLNLIGINIPIKEYCIYVLIPWTTFLGIMWLVRAKEEILFGLMGGLFGACLVSVNEVVFDGSVLVFCIVLFAVMQISIRKEFATE